MTVDLSRLPPPPLLTVDPAALLEQMHADLKQKWPAADRLSPSSPATKVLENGAFLAALLRQEINEQAMGNMLALSVGAALDQLVANFGVVRAVVDPGDPTAIPPRPPVMEDDERLRTRAQQAFEGLSVAGPAGAYRFHALSASADVLDVDVSSPAPGTVQVHVLSRVGDGVPSTQLLAVVRAALNADHVRPLTDRLEVLAGTRVDYAVAARLELSPGPDGSVVLQSAIAAATAYVARQRRFRELVTVDGLHAALRQEGVRRVWLDSPTEALTTGIGAYPHCTAISVGVA